MDDREERKRARMLLGEWGTIDQARKQAQSRIHALQAQVNDAHDPTKAQVLTGMPGSGTISDPTATVAERAIEITESATVEADAIVKQIDSVTRRKIMIDELLYDLTQLHRDIVIYKYKNDYDWDHISLKLHYSKSLCQLREQEAVNYIARNIARILGNVGCNV